MNQWLSIIADDRFSDEDKCLVMSENLLIMLYNCIDLFAQKVCFARCISANKNLIISIFDLINDCLDVLTALSSYFMFSGVLGSSQ